MEKLDGMFNINGIGGYLIAVVLLLSILGVFQVLSFGVQSASAQNPYVISGDAFPDPQTKAEVFKNLQEVDMISSNPAATQARVK